MNNVQLSGRITLMQTKSITTKSGEQIPAVSFGLAVTNPKNREETFFISCFASGKTSDVITKYFQKGDGIYISDGYIKVSSYTDKNGQNRNSWSVIVSSIEFPLSKKSSTQTQTQQQQTQTQQEFTKTPVAEEEEDFPF